MRLYVYEDNLVFETLQELMLYTYLDKKSCRVIVTVTLYGHEVDISILLKFE